MLTARRRLGVVSSAFFFLDQPIAAVLRKYSSHAFLVRAALGACVYGG
jgi:hypothetical protein